MPLLRLHYDFATAADAAIFAIMPPVTIYQYTIANGITNTLMLPCLFSAAAAIRFTITFTDYLPLLPLIFFFAIFIISSLPLI